MRPALVALLGSLLASGCRGRSRTDRVLGPMAQDAVPVAVIQPPDAGPPLSAVSEREPNDSPGQAQELPAGKPILGHIHKPGKQADRDYFSLRVPEGAGRQILWIRLSSPASLKLTLEVRKHPSYERIAHRRAARPGASLVLPNLALLPGKYYVGVSASDKKEDAKHPYVLSWRLGAWQEGQEIEPNDLRAKATPLLVGRDTTGYFGRARDVDWYVLPESRPQDIYTIQLEGVRGVRAELAVCDNRGRVLLKRKGRTGRRIAVHNLASPASPFYLRVRALAGSNPEDAYLLRVERGTAGPGTELEPNDTVASAMTLSARRGSLEGLLENPQDRDVYRILVSRPMSLRLEVRPEKGLDVIAGLLGPKGRVVLKADAGGPGFTELFPDLPVRGRDRYVMIRRGKRGKRSGRYTFTWVLSPLDRADEGEPNDRPSQATRLLPGNAAKGYIYPPGDKDWYWFEFPGVPGNTVRIRLSAQGLPRVRLRLRLLDGMRNVLAESSRQSPAGERKVELNIHVGKRYYVVVDDDSGRRANPSDTYELELVKLW